MSVRINIEKAKSMVFGAEDTAFIAWLKNQLHDWPEAYENCTLHIEGRDPSRRVVGVEFTPLNRSEEAIERLNKLADSLHQYQATIKGEELERLKHCDQKAAAHSPKKAGKKQ